MSGVSFYHNFGAVRFIAAIASPPSEKYSELGDAESRNPFVLYTKTQAEQHERVIWHKNANMQERHRGGEKERERGERRDKKCATERKRNK